MSASHSPVHTNRPVLLAFHRGRISPFLVLKDPHIHIPLMSHLAYAFRFASIFFFCLSVPRPPHRPLTLVPRPSICIYRTMFVYIPLQLARDCNLFCERVELLSFLLRHCLYSLLCIICVSLYYLRGQQALSYIHWTCNCVRRR